METHVMTFFMPPSSGLCVKSCLRCNDIPVRRVVFPRCWPGMRTTPLHSRCGDAACGTLNPHRTHALPTARSDFPVLRKKEKASKGGISSSVYYLSGKKTNGQEEELLPSRWKSAVVEFRWGDSCRKPKSGVFLRLLALQICFLKRANVTQPFKPFEAFNFHTLPDNLWLFCVT